jgi:hypothetical protein
MNTSVRAYGSTINVDKVIFSMYEPIAVNNTVSGVPQRFTTQNTTTGLNQIGRPLGIFSTDSGNTWNDMGSASGSSGILHTSPPSVVVSCSSGVSGRVYVDVTVNALVGGGGTFNMMVGVVVLAEDNPTPLTQLPVLSGKSAYASRSTQDGSSTYREITLTGNETVASGTGQIPIPHNLGYVPDLWAWWQQGNENKLQGSTMIAGDACVTVDSTNVYVWKQGSAGEYLWRGYKP